MIVTLTFDADGFVAAVEVAGDINKVNPMDFIRAEMDIDGALASIEIDELEQLYNLL